MRERLINRRQQGDLGEASAIEWLTSVGATVLIPFGHSPDFDLIAEIDGRLLRIQVKTSAQTVRTPDGHLRCPVQIATLGGNQSWTGVTKRFDPSRYDFLFVLVGDGRRWFIPCRAVEAQTAITLGGPKYSEFEIDPGQPIAKLIHGPDTPPVKSKSRPGEYPRGQRMAAVNRPALAFAGSTPASPISPLHVADADLSKYERKLGKSGQAIVNQKRRITIPQRPFLEAGLENGAKLRVRCEGVGRLILERTDPRT